MRSRKFREVVTAVVAVAVQVAPELVAAHAEVAALAESVVVEVVLRVRLRYQGIEEANVRARAAIGQEREQAWCPRVAAADRAERLVGPAEPPAHDRAAIGRAELVVDQETFPVDQAPAATDLEILVAPDPVGLVIDRVRSIVQV
jgi:hypothetical protein